MDHQQVLLARDIASPVGHAQAAVDVAPLFVCQYVPALGTSGASSRIAFVVGSSMTFTVAGAAPAGKDLIGAAGIVDTSSSTYNTLGELIDYINSRQAWRAYLVAALRVDKTSITLAKSAADSSTAEGLTFYGDTSANWASIVPGTAGTAEQIGTAISSERFVSNGVNGHQKDSEEMTENSLLYANLTLTATGTPSVNIYSAAQTGTETKLFSAVVTSTTNMQLGNAGSANAVDGAHSIFIRANLGERLVIRASAGTLTTITKFEMLGQSAVISGAHVSLTTNYTAG